MRPTAQKEQLDHQIAHRERQLQADADRKVRTVAKLRDKALEQINELRKDRLLERLFIDAEGRPGGDNRGSCFDIFKQQVGGEFRQLHLNGISGPSRWILMLGI